jgi:sulfoxide reductase catalytic subunit YedY
MRIHVPKDWALPESAATPESAYRRRDRRDFVKTIGLGAAGALLAPIRTLAATAGLPAKDNPDYPAGALKVTPYDLATSYNNFYEFGTDKGDPVVNANRGWKTEPWTVELGGLVRNPGKWDVDDLVRKLGGVEQRVYRHRCVEAWSMVIPWDGFPLAKLIDLADPQPAARFVTFTSFVDPKDASGQRDDDSMGWPYLEGLRLDEARHELTLIATGIYGKPLPNQNGAPLRLVVPWKYGFKGIKSIVRIELTERAPINTWQRLAANEYGFYANVNPQVDHPRWSQASERVIGGSFFSGRQPTLMFNGYEKQVAGLYAGLNLKTHY